MEKTMIARWAFGIVSFWLVCHSIAAADQVQLVGPEFQVNDFVTDYQTEARVSGGPLGFAVIWRRIPYYDPETTTDCTACVVLRRFHLDATPASAEREVFEGVPGGLFRQPDLFLQSDLGVVVIAQQDTGTFEFGSYTGRLAADDSWGPWQNLLDAGQSTYTTQPRIAGVSSFNSLNDRSIALWADTSSLQGRFIDPDGTVGATITAHEARPNAGIFDVAMTWSGSFMAVWVQYDSDNDGIWARLFDPDGTPASDPFLVNLDEEGLQQYPAVACNALGDYVVVWTKYTMPFTGEVFYRRYWSDGTPRDPVDVQVSTGPAPGATRADVVYDNIERRGVIRGAFLVVWTAYDADSYGVVGRMILDSGIPLGDEFPINTFTAGPQTNPLITTTRPHDLVVIWESQDGQDGDLSGLFGQRLTAPLFVDGFERGGLLYWSDSR